MFYYIPLKIVEIQKKLRYILSIIVTTASYCGHMITNIERRKHTRYSREIQPAVVYQLAKESLFRRSSFSLARLIPPGTSFSTSFENLYMGGVIPGLPWPFKKRSERSL